MTVRYEWTGDIDYPRAGEHYESEHSFSGRLIAIRARVDLWFKAKILRRIESDGEGVT